MTDSTPGLPLVDEALRRGVRVLWDPPRFRGPSPALALAKQAGDTAREVLRRAVIFRTQAEEPGVILLLTIPGAPDSPGGCISCGIPIPHGEFRCPLCQTAVRLALDFAQPDGGDG
jgi:hypothetical protein